MCKRLTVKFANWAKRQKSSILFSSLIRVCFEIYLDVFFGACYNIYNIRIKNGLDVYSIIVSIIWLILLFALLGYIIYVIVKADPDNLKDSILKYRAKVLLEEMKEDNKYNMLEHVFFILQRMILILLVIFLWGHGLAQVFIFGMTWVFRMIFKIYKRPYLRISKNIQEIWYEVWLLVISFIFMAFYDPDTEFVTTGTPYVLGIICWILLVFVVILNYTFTISHIMQKIFKKRYVQSSYLSNGDGFIKY